MELIGIAGVVAAVALALLAMHRRAAALAAAASAPLPGGAPARIPCEGDDDAVAAWIWRHLVPRSGQSLTVQGELLRAVEKLRHEAQGNGNINWNEHFEKLIDFLHTHLVRRGALPSGMALAVLADLARLRNFLPVEALEHDDQADGLPYVDDDLYDRLTAAVVAFARMHTLVIPRGADPELLV
ncbi:hypothetical protein [Massilia sp. Leaf139]|uniref:hypothetical protein n=1 Tax=Massilia sp. Leaf139 TaxID=1736272 RepID=UPI000AF37DDA|nr:hypothetical protein [Massilia sp. Leaf139]